MFKFFKEKVKNVISSITEKFEKEAEPVQEEPPFYRSRSKANDAKRSQTAVPFKPLDTAGTKFDPPDSPVMQDFQFLKIGFEQAFYPVFGMGNSISVGNPPAAIITNSGHKFMLYYIK